MAGRKIDEGWKARLQILRPIPDGLRYPRGMETAMTLNCHSCGAGVRSDWPACRHCGAGLATMACPTCFGMMILGSKFCPHCAAAAVAWEPDSSERKCPSCAGAMLHGTIGQTSVHECGRCYGLWLDRTSFDTVCRDQDRQASVLAGRVEGEGGAVESSAAIRYRRCLVCSELMHRTNYARCSGVIIDTCAQHGVWFDRNELQRIVEFIQKGGLDRAREREKQDLVEARRRAEAATAAAGANAGLMAPMDYPAYSDSNLPFVIELGGEILGAILRGID